MTPAQDHALKDRPSLTLPDWRTARSKARFRKPKNPRKWYFLFWRLYALIVLCHAIERVLIGDFAYLIDASVQMLFYVLWTRLYRREEQRERAGTGGPLLPIEWAGLVAGSLVLTFSFLFEWKW